MSLQFVTGSKKKFEEFQRRLPALEMHPIDLTEIQSACPKLIIAAKLTEAARKHPLHSFMIVEDTCLHLDCLKGLPGPLIKWFLQEMGSDGLANVADRMGDHGATARTTIGLITPLGYKHFYEGTVRGRVGISMATTDFGWDNIFYPEDSDVTFAEMSPEAKDAVSMRGRAIDALVKGLDQFAGVF